MDQKWPEIVVYAKSCLIFFSQEDVNVSDEEEASKKLNAASDKDSVSGDTNVDENQDVSDYYYLFLSNN